MQSKITVCFATSLFASIRLNFIKLRRAGSERPRRSEFPPCLGVKEWIRQCVGLRAHLTDDLTAVLKQRKIDVGVSLEAWTLFCSL